VARAQRLQRIPDLHGRCLLVSRAADGGRSRDRTSHPFHVKMAYPTDDGAKDQKKRALASVSHAGTAACSRQGRNLTPRVGLARSMARSNDHNARARRSGCVSLTATRVHVCKSVVPPSPMKLASLHIFMGGAMALLAGALGRHRGWPATPGSLESAGYGAQ